MFCRKTVNLGPEYDDRLFDALKEVLRREGAEEVSTRRRVVGSQDITRWRVRLHGNTITIVIETYAGISIRGCREAIERIEAEVAREGTRPRISHESETGRSEDVERERK